MTCDRCYQPATDGEHGIGLCPLEPRRGHWIVPDDIPGGEQIQHCPGLHGQWVYTKSERNRLAAEKGWENRVYWTGEHDQHVARMVAVDLTDYDAPEVIEARQRAMAEHCGLTLEAYLELRSQPVTSRLAGDIGAPDMIDAVIHEHILRAEARA